MSSTDSRRDGRRFAVGAFVLLALLGGWLVHRSRPMAGVVVGGAGACFLVMGWAIPSAALAVRRGWMVVARALGWINTRILLAVFFFLVLTPIAILRRMFGRDAFRPGRSDSGFWQSCERPRDPKHYERPY